MIWGGGGKFENEFIFSSQYPPQISRRRAFEIYFFLEEGLRIFFSIFSAPPPQDHSWSSPSIVENQASYNSKMINQSHHMIRKCRHAGNNTCIKIFSFLVLKARETLLFSLFMLQNAYIFPMFPSVFLLVSNQTHRSVQVEGQRAAL